MTDSNNESANICIVTDSTCDLPPEVVNALNIHVVPCYVNMDGSSYLDGVEISRAEFFERLPNLAIPATTAAPGVGLFEEVYRKLIENGATKILSIHVSSTLSSVMENAKVAAQNVHENIIEVIDSGQLSLGLGYLVEEAARAVKAGMQSISIVNMIQEKIKDVFLYAVLDTLEYLRRSGRISSLKSGLGYLLKIKPIIVVHQGEVLVEMVRTKSKAVNMVCKKIADLGNLRKISLVHGHALDAAKSVLKSIDGFIPRNNGSFYFSEITPAIGVHVGPKAVGVICVKE
ncbi:MAG: DegV family protein [Anaerolineaceae bacterium]|nr:DegV family protein [Anaerolineaceae bacterium]